MTKEEIQTEITRLESRYANLDGWWQKRLLRKERLEAEKGIHIVVMEQDLLFKRDQVAYHLEELKKKLAAL